MSDYHIPPDLIALFGDLRARIATLERTATIPVVSALPSPAIDGQEIFYVADATAGVVWRLRYRAASASAYKWEFVGGAPLVSAVAASQTTASTSYVDLATVGPSITLPLGGDYDVPYGATMEGTAQDRFWTSVKIAAAATSDAEAISQAVGNPAAQSQGAAGSRTLRFTGRTAADVLKLQYRTTLGATGTFLSRWIAARPVRVG